MSREESINEVVNLLMGHLDIERLLAEYLAEKIYVRVVKPAIDETNDGWLALCDRKDSDPQS